MDLNQQIQDLIDNAPQDGTTPDAVKAIAPALQFVAQQLKHPQYYILQTLDGRWVMTALNHRTQANTQKNVIYAFSDLKDAAASLYAKDPQVMAMPIPVTHALFQMVAMNTLDSIIFFEAPGNANVGTEVTRENLQSLIQLHLQQAQAGASLPPDIA